MKQAGIQPSVLSPLSGVLPLCFQFYTFPINSALFPAVLFISNKSVCLIDGESKFYWLRSKISGWLVGSCFEPSQPQGIISGLRANSSVSPSNCHSTSQYITSLFFSDHNSNYSHNSGTQNHKSTDTCFWAYLYSAGTQHGNLHQSSITTSRVTYFILRAHTGTGVSHNKHRKHSGDFWDKMQLTGPEG